MAKKRKKTPRTRNLVLGYIERISSQVFSDFPKELTNLAGKQHGVYALYKGDRLYYVGLATNLRNRIRGHLRGPHRGKWDRFSLYLVRKAGHIRELESLILKIADPTGNKMMGRLPRAHNLRRKLDASVKKAQDEKRKRLFEVKGVRGKKAPKSGRRQRKVAARGEPPLGPYVSKGFTLRGTYKGKVYRAHVRAGTGKVNYDGVLYNSPSLAGQAVKGRACNGWKFWRYRNDKGGWVQLDELRK